MINRIIAPICAAILTGGAAIATPLTPAHTLTQPVNLAKPNLMVVAPSIDFNRVPAATNTIISETPEGTPMQDVVWSSKACAPVNGKAQWSEISGFVPQIITNGNDIYIYAPITQLSELGAAWIVGRISDDGKTATFKTPQAYMINEANPGDISTLYATRLDGTSGKLDPNNLDIVFSIEDGNLTQTDGGVIAITDLQGNFYGYGDMDIRITKINDQLVTLPEGLEPSTYVMQSQKNGEMQKQSALIAISGTDVFFSDPLASGNWFKGTLDGNDITVATPQYVGTASGFPMYVTAGEAFTRTETAPTGETYQVTDYRVLPNAELHFVLDPATGEISSEQLLLMNAGKETRGSAYAAYDKALFIPYTYHETTPSQPSASYYLDLDEYAGSYGLSGCMLVYRIPSYDIEGEFLPQENLYYEICFDGKPLEFYETTRIPYYGQFQDAALNAAITVAGDDHQLQTLQKPKESVTVQSFYEFQGKMIPSEISKYILVEGNLVPDGAGVEMNAEAATVVSVGYYDLSGRRIVAAEGAGVVIRQSILSDGTRRSEKIIL